jgi:hypothetical protein
LFFVQHDRVPGEARTRGHQAGADLAPGQMQVRQHHCLNEPQPWKGLRLICFLRRTGPDA